MPETTSDRSVDTVTLIEGRPGEPIVKSYDRGAWSPPTDFQGGYEMRPETYPVGSLRDLYEVLQALAGDPTRAIIRGAVKPHLEGVWARRIKIDKPGAEATYVEAAHHWVACDIDTSIQPLDPNDPEASIREWRASLPAPLRAAAMVFKLSAKAHLSPTLRGHAWIWAETPVGYGELRAWCMAHGFDTSITRCVQPHYTADPLFPVPGDVDPYAGRRLYWIDGNETVKIDWTKVSPPKRLDPELGGAAMPVGVDPTDVLATIGPAQGHEGQRFYLCSALGGVMRRAGWEKARAAQTIRAWLEPVPGCDVENGVRWAVGAWDRDPEHVTSVRELALYLGEDWATAIYHAADPMARAAAAWDVGDVATYQAARAAVPDRSAPAPADHDPIAVQGPPLTVAGIDLTAVRPDLLSAPKKQMYILENSGTYFGPLHVDLMVPTLRAVGLLNLVRDENGKLLSDEKIYKRGAPVHVIERSFGEQGTSYDANTFTLRQGYTLPPIAPVYDPRVDAWLRVMAGDLLPNLLDWIALCDQKQIGRRACAMVIVGPHSTGKSLIFKCLGRMWGAPGYVKLSEAIATFNQSIVYSPIVCDDEAIALKAELVSADEFRDRTQADQRKFEPKGLEKVTLLGYSRECIAANSTDDVVIAKVHDASTREAVEKRLCVIQIDHARADDVRAALIAIGGGDEHAERDRIMGHVAWIWATHTVISTERFLGAGGAGVRAVGLAAAAKGNEDLWDLIRELIADPAVPIPDGKASDTLSPPPFILRDGQLRANIATLAAMLELRGRRNWEQKRIKRALGPLLEGDHVKTWIGRTHGKSFWYWPIDQDRLAELIGLDDTETPDPAGA